MANKLLCRLNGNRCYGENDQKCWSIKQGTHVCFIEVVRSEQKLKVSEVVSRVQSGEDHSGREQQGHRYEFAWCVQETAWRRLELSEQGVE